MTRLTSWHSCPVHFLIHCPGSAIVESVGMLYQRRKIHGAFATDSLSLCKLPNTYRILRIVPAKNKQSRIPATLYLFLPSFSVTASLCSGTVAIGSAHLPICRSLPTLPVSGSRTLPRLTGPLVPYVRPHCRAAPREMQRKKRPYLVSRRACGVKRSGRRPASVLPGPPEAKGFLRRLFGRRH